MTITLLENFRAAFYAPFYAAHALKAFEAEGLEVEIKKSPDAAQTIYSLMAGSGEVSWGGPIRLMQALEKKPESRLVAFCEVVGKDPFFLLARTPNPAFAFGDLNGKSIAVVNEVPTPWMCLQYDLRLAGVDSSKLSVREDRTMAENAAALRDGKVDVIQVFQPYAQRLIEEGRAHIWYSAATRGQTSYTTLNTTRQFIEKDPKTILGMCRAMYRTQRWIEGHDGRELAQAVQSYFPDVPASTLAAAYDTYKTLGLWNRQPQMSREGFEWLRDAGLATEHLHTKFPYEDCADMRFAEQAVKDDPPPL